MDAIEFAKLHRIAFDNAFPGLKPNVVESPNGDGYEDLGKKYSHIAEKYLNKRLLDDYSYATSKAALKQYTEQAITHAIELGLPSEFWPSWRSSCLRILEYPPGIGSRIHTDMSLFTMPLYRNIFGPSGTQIGELLHEIWPRMKPTAHQVLPNSYRTQYSAVFFAIPEHSAVLPSGQTVGEFLETRLAKSRRNIQ